MSSHPWRKLAKRTLAVARVRLLYRKITLTRFTTFYFFFAIISCAILSSMQVVIFAQNCKATAILKPFVENVSLHIVVVLDKHRLQTCTDIPTLHSTVCKTRLDFDVNLNAQSHSESPMWNHGGLDARGKYIDIVSNDEYVPDNRIRNSTSKLLLDPRGNCALSLSWVAEMVQDSKREDIVTFLFQIWMFSLAMVVILNESIPHLGAAFLAHILSAAWAGYRVSSTHAMRAQFKNAIVPMACGGMDVMGKWWDDRLKYSIPIVICSALTLLAFMYLSLKLYRAYANESFHRVGASPKIHKIYKLVLFFSVCLQLSGFFCIASTVMWVDKVLGGSLQKMARHSEWYKAGFIIVLVLQFPLLYIGWTCVRRESKIRFWIFFAISAMLIAISTALFVSPLYRYVMEAWAFFTNVALTAYILGIITCIAAMICRLNFGQGLAHYLQVTEALEGIDFTPVSFSNDPDGDPEKLGYEKSLEAFADFEPSTKSPLEPDILRVPPISHQETKSKLRGDSIYSEAIGYSIKLSCTPPLVSESSSSRPSSYTRLSKALTDRLSAGLWTRWSKQIHVVEHSFTSHPDKTPAAVSRSDDAPAGPPGLSSPRKIGLPSNPRAGRAKRGPI